jgi:hypothetical protein
MDGMPALPESRGGGRRRLIASKPGQPGYHTEDQNVRIEIAPVAFRGRSD